MSNKNQAAMADALARLSAAYPSFTLDDETCKVYAQALADIDYIILGLAIDDAIKGSKWFPSIAQIRELAAMRGAERRRGPELDHVGGRCSKCCAAVPSIKALDTIAKKCKHDKVVLVVHAEVRQCCGASFEEKRARVCAKCIFEVIGHGSVPKREGEDQRRRASGGGEASGDGEAAD